MASPPSTLFALRFDHQATQEGQRGGLPFQSTEWEPINSNDWENAKHIARERVKHIPSHRFDSRNPHYLQGIVLVDLRRDSLRFLAFTVKCA